MALSPMMQQYFGVKEEYPDYIIMFRLGDFYEMFFEDAKLASRELELTLTGRDCGEGERAPMCGVPFHKADVYIGRLIEHGYKVAICEQTEDPAKAKGLVKREVVRVITPGTVLDPEILEEKRNNYLCSLCFSEGACGAAFSDISTGKVYATEFKGKDRIERLCSELASYAPSEILTNVTCDNIPKVTAFVRERLRDVMISDRSPELFAFDGAKDRVCKYFGREQELALFAHTEMALSVSAMLAYISTTQKTDKLYVSLLDIYLGGRYMELDSNCIRNLELTETMRTKDRKGSLLDVVDKTRTAMGARLLRTRLLRPLLSVPEIRRRQNAVKDLYDDFIVRDELRSLLNSVLDLERLTAKTVYGSANARDILAVGNSLEPLSAVKGLISRLGSDMFRTITSDFDDLEDIRSLIAKSINPSAPLALREGNLIADGYNTDVDFLRKVRDNGTGWIKEVEEKEKEATGIKTLKVSYNRVFGYYIEVTNSQKELVPDRYIRKQTLSGSERYITEELKEIESTILGANDKLCALEYNLFCDIRNAVSAAASRIFAAADKIAEIDVYASFAEVAKKLNYVCPEVDNSTVLEIKDGRHPVVERYVGDSYFVPNDTWLDTDKNRLMLITGPNMAGKSTYMRQVAIIVLLAQTGAFVPARDARIGIADMIFTRVGASDDLASGQSTFMLEMTEVSQILSKATERSLIVYDEIGRGTSTYDGMSIARAVAEYSAKKICARTLFATHYHELTVMENEIVGVVNYNIAAKKRGDSITFLRKIVRGSTDDSYGIDVAKLAGVPNEVVKRAREVLKTIESGAPVTASVKPIALKEEFNLFTELEDSINSDIAERLRKTDLNTLTPIEAINLVWELKGMLNSKD
ncbi:MAG: DNA mismatch repair protein MutS [Ruminococcaceae bacterium]|nr:DNA mismatch repair protein MutS [Oscillospiraceae bacterium]